MPPRRIILAGTSDGISGRTWRARGQARIGRLAEMEIALDHTSVSRLHAEINCDARGWFVVDQGSTNGTFVNGARVTRAGHLLHAGDVLQIGQMILKITDAHAGGGNSFLLSADRMRLNGSITRSWEEAVQENGSTDRRSGSPDRRLLIRHLGRDFYDARSLDTYLHGVLWSAADALRAQYGAILTWAPGATEPELRADLACGQEMTRELWVKSRPVHAAMAHGRSELYDDPRATDADTQVTPSEGALGSLICAVLRSPRQTIGLLCLARSVDCDPFHQSDLLLADDLALAISPTVESLDRFFAEKRQLLLGALTSLAQTIELRDESLGIRSQRVTAYALMLADEIHVSAAERQLLQMGAPLHNLGKIALPDALLHKCGSFNKNELDQITSVPRRGAALVETIAGLEDFLPIVRNHRERWDGRGYPDGLAGDQIPLVARIVGAADALDTMTTDRPDGPALPLPEAFAELERMAGAELDPECVSALIRLRPMFEEMFNRREECAKTWHSEDIRKTRASIFLGV